ncbi:hypothetical protein [Kordia sp.]|uniref:hypothetical protein n=1 Tax=Kordia sp. TaxID=1965332 RepID=UPI003D6AD318
MKKKQTLRELEERNKELYPLIFKNYDTMKELKDYKISHKHIFDEYYINLEKIKALEWELMTPEEQAKKIELRRKIIAKNKRMNKS